MTAQACAPQVLGHGWESRYYDLPTFGDGGCSDSLMLDDQWAFEAGMTLLTAAVSGVTLLHDLGYVSSGTASSYESIVISQDQYDGWTAAGSSSLLARTAERTRESRESERAYAPAPDALRDLDRLVDEARRSRQTG